MRTSWIVLLIALALVLGKGTGTAQEVDQYISAFEDTQLELVKYPLDYPNRAIGRLLLKDIGNLDSSVCNAFLIGKNRIATSAHCYFGKTTNARELRFSLNKEVAVHFKMQRNYKVDLSTVRSGWHGYESGSPWDWATFDLAADPGTRLGYFGVHKGWGKISAGSPGTEPSPSGDSPACKAVHVSETAALKWATDPLNFLMVLLNFYDEPDEWIFSGIIPSARVCQAGYPLYHPGTKRRLRTKAPLYISNCGLGGIVTNTMISNCSATAGMSGGPMFYHEPGTESYVAIGITKSALPGDFVPFLKHGFGRTHYNKSSFIGITELPHYYHPELGDRSMASKQFSWGEERE